jgi:uncharacterized protein YgbK (DUF1537 family)
MAPTPPTFIVADDLTGSADSALPFWRAGLRASILFEPNAPWPRNEGVLSLCTHSRAKSESEAHAVVSAIARHIPAGARVFKKIDSTLRGWIGSESLALHAAMPERTLVFAPAYPTKGRTLGADGVYRVHGAPLSETEFAPEITGLDPDSRLTGFLRRHFGQHARRVRVVSAENPVELSAAVNEIPEPALWVGSPGLGIALAGRGSLPGAPTPVPPALPAARIVVAAGSRRSLTRQQAQALEAAVRPHADATLTLLRIPEQAFDPHRALVLAADLGKRAGDAAHALAAKGPVGLILTGGDIAAATCAHLGITGAEIVGEVEDGLPVLRAGHFVFVTKAGGFGSELSLVRAYVRLSSFLA